jgi:hypothetical protein
MIASLTLDRLNRPRGDPDSPTPDPILMSLLIDSHLTAGSGVRSDCRGVHARGAGVDASLVILAADDQAELQRLPPSRRRGRRCGSRSVSTRTPLDVRTTMPTGGDAGLRAPRCQPALAQVARSVSTITTTSRRATSSSGFAAHTALARPTPPCVISTREADEDTFGSLKEAAPPRGASSLLHRRPGCSATRSDPASTSRCRES